MTSSKGTAGILDMDFSTDGIPQRHRLEHWREAFAKAIVNMDWCPALDRPFQQEAKVRAIPGLGVVAGTHTSTGFVARRTPELISTGTDDLVLTLPLAGCFIQSQLGREIKAVPGEAVLASCSDVGTVMLPPNGRFIALALPRRALVPMLPQIQDHVGVLLPADSEPLRLLSSYISALLTSDDTMSSTLQELVVTHVYDLVALALDPKQEAAAHAQHRGLPAARLHAIKSDIIAHLGDNDLTESSIANRHHVSSRYVRMLFEADGTTFSDFLRLSRLTRAHQILTNRRNCDRTISSIAYEVGFGDLSHFNRLFRKSYGARPSEIRAQMWAA